MTRSLHAGARQASVRLGRGGRGWRLAGGVCALVACCACAGSGSPMREGAVRTPVGQTVRVAKNRPSVSVVLREGDPRGAVAVAVATEGIVPERGAEVAVALAGLVEERLEARGIHDVTVVAGWDGYRVRALVANGVEAASLVEATRAALLTPVDAGGPGLAGARRKVAALARRPIADKALLDSVRCSGEPFATRDAQAMADAPRVEDLETWRRAAHGLGRVAFATVGGERVAEDAVSALGRADAWPSAAPIEPSPLPAPFAPPEIYEATGLAGARVTIAAHTASPAEAVATAYALGDPRGPLASRLGALDAPAKVRTVTAAAHATGGCLAVTFDLSPRDLTTDAPGRIATAAALARQELAVELEERGECRSATCTAAELRETRADVAIAHAVALGANDPRDAAERAAWWALAGPRPSRDGTGLRFSVAIGLAVGRDAESNPSAAAIRSDLDRATVAWHAPVVEAKARVERGQSEMWILLASPCGTLSEIDADAGLAATVALATAEQAARTYAAKDALAQVEPWVTSDGVGLLVHGPAAPRESPAAQARRLSDLAARSFAADPLDPALVTEARATLLGRATTREGRELTGLANALAPGRASWLSPLGTAEALARASDTAVLLRASALRAGPLRVAVIASSDESQSRAAVAAVDRWIARRPGEVRACPVGVEPSPRPGTYAVDVAGAAEALLAIPLPPNDEDARSTASWVAAALDGEDGLLAKALAQPGSRASLADAWSVKVFGPAQHAALVVRVVSTNASLDDAVAQTRALLDRVRKGALVEADRARAAAARERDDLTASLDPRARVIALFRGEGDAPRAAPSLETLRAFAAATLRDEALVIVAARPARARAP